MNMTPNMTQLIEYRLKRSKETYKDAELLINGGSYISGVNRIYYACFYSVLAYLHKINVSARTHEGVKAMFGLHLVKTGKIEKEFAAFYSRVLSKRISGDYDEFEKISESEARDFLTEAGKFINKIEEVVRD